MKSYTPGNSNEDDESFLDKILFPVQQGIYFLGIPASVVALRKSLNKRSKEIQDTYKPKVKKSTQPNLGFTPSYFEQEYLGAMPENINEVIENYNNEIHNTDMATMEAIYNNEKSEKLRGLDFNNIEDKEFIKEVVGVDNTTSPQEAWAKLQDLEDSNPQEAKALKELIVENDLKKTIGLQMQLHKEGYNQALQYDTKRAYQTVDVKHKLVQEAVKIIQRNTDLRVESVIKKDIRGNWLVEVTNTVTKKTSTIVIPKTDSSDPFKIKNREVDLKGVKFQGNKTITNSIVVKNGQQVYLQPMVVNYKNSNNIAVSGALGWLDHLSMTLRQVDGDLDKLNKKMEAATRNLEKPVSPGNDTRDRQYSASIKSNQAYIQVSSQASQIDSYYDPELGRMIGLEQDRPEVNTQVTYDELLKRKTTIDAGSFLDFIEKHKVEIEKYLPDLDKLSPLERVHKVAELAKNEKSIERLVTNYDKKNKITFDLEDVFEGSGNLNAQGVAENLNYKGLNIVNTVNKNITEPAGIANRARDIWHTKKDLERFKYEDWELDKSTELSTKVEQIDTNYKYKKVKGYIKKRFRLSKNASGDEALNILQSNNLDIDKAIQELKSKNPENENIRTLEKLKSKTKGMRKAVQKYKTKIVEHEFYQTKSNEYAEKVFKSIEKEHIKFVNRTGGFNHNGESLANIIGKKRRELREHIDTNTDISDLFSPREETIIKDIHGKQQRTLNEYYKKLDRKLARLEKSLKDTKISKNQYLVKAEHKGNELVLNFGTETFHERKKANAQYNQLDKLDDHIRKSSSMFTTILNDVQATEIGAVQGSAVYLHRGDSDLNKRYKTKNVSYTFYTNNGITFMELEDKNKAGNSQVEIKAQKGATEVLRTIAQKNREIKKLAKENPNMVGNNTVVEFNGRRFEVKVDSAGFVPKRARSERNKRSPGEQAPRAEFNLMEIIEETSSQATSKEASIMAKSTVKVINIDNTDLSNIAEGAIRNDAMIGSFGEHLKGGDRGKGQQFMFDAFNQNFHNSMVYLKSAIRDKRGLAYESLKQFMQHEKVLTKRLLGNTLFTFQNLGNSDLLEMHKEFTSTGKFNREKYSAEEIRNYRIKRLESRRYASTLTPDVYIDNNGNHITTVKFDENRFRRVTKNNLLTIRNPSDMMPNIPRITFESGKKAKSLIDDLDSIKDVTEIQNRRRIMNAGEGSLGTFLEYAIKKANPGSKQQKILYKLMTTQKRYNSKATTGEKAIRVGEENGHVLSHMLVVNRDKEGERFYAANLLSTIHVANFENPAYKNLGDSIKVDSLFLFKLKAKNPAFYNLVQHGNQAINKRFMAEFNYQQNFLDLRKNMRENLKYIQSEIGKVNVDNFQKLHPYLFKGSNGKTFGLTQPFVYDEKQITDIVGKRTIEQHKQVEEIINEATGHSIDTDPYNALLHKLENGKAQFGINRIGEGNLNEIEKALKNIEGLTIKGGVAEGNVLFSKLLGLDAATLGNNPNRLDDIKIPLRVDFNEIRQSITSTVNGQKYFDIDQNSSHGMSFKLLSHIHALKLISDKKNELGKDKAEALSRSVLKGITNAIEEHGHDIEHNAGKTGNMADKMYKRNISGTFNMFNSVDMSTLQEKDLNNKIFESRGSLGQASMTGETFLDVTLGKKRHDFARKISDQNEIRDTLNKMIKGTTGKNLSDIELDNLLKEYSYEKHLGQQSALDKKIEESRKAGSRDLKVLEALKQKASRINPDQIRQVSDIYNDKANTDLLKIYRRGKERIKEIKRGSIELVESFRHPLHTFGDFVSERVNIVAETHMRRGEILGSWANQIRRFGDEDKDLTYYMNRGLASFFKPENTQHAWWEAQNVFKNNMNYILGHSVDVGLANNDNFMRGLNYQAEKMILKHGEVGDSFKFILQDTGARVNYEIDNIAKIYGLKEDRIQLLKKEAQKHLQGVKGQAFFIKDNLQSYNDDSLSRVRGKNEEGILSVTKQSDGTYAYSAHMLKENNVFVGKMLEQYNYTTDATKANTKKYKALAEMYKDASKEVFNSLDTENAIHMNSYFNQTEDAMKKQKTGAGKPYKEVTLANMRMQTLKGNGSQAITEMRNMVANMNAPGLEKAKENFMRMTGDLIDPKNLDHTNANVKSFVEALLDKTVKPVAEELALQIKHGGHDIVASTVGAFKSLQDMFSGKMNSSEVSLDQKAIQTIKEIGNLGLKVETSGRHKDRSLTQKEHNTLLERELGQVDAMVKNITGDNLFVRTEKGLHINPGVNELIKKIDTHVDKTGVMNVLHDVSQDFKQGYDKNIHEGIQTHLKNTHTAGVKLSTGLLGLVKNNLDELSGNYRIVGKSSGAGMFSEDTAFAVGVINSYIKNKDPLREKAANMFYEVHQSGSKGLWKAMKEIENHKDRKTILNHYKEIADVDIAGRDNKQRQSQQNYRPESGALHSSEGYHQKIAQLKGIGKSALVGTFLAAGINQIMGGYSLPDLKDTAGVGGERYENYKTKEAENLIKPPPPRVDVYNPNYRENKRLELGYAEQNHASRRQSIKNYTVDNKIQQENIGVKIR